MRSPLAVVALLLLPAALAACPPSSDAECAGPADCAAPDDAPCAVCAAPAAELCLEGACTPRSADAVDVSATISIDRDIDQDVQGLAWVIAAADRSCSDVGSFTAFPADLNAYASGQKTLAGGGFHPDVGLARAPAGALLVLALATEAPAADGAVLGSGCAEATATAPSLAIPELVLAP